jgi:DNA (cytosine-5)-methyltransferase 1
MNCNQLALFKEESWKTSPFIELCSALSVRIEPGWPDKFGAALLSWARGNIKMPIKTLSLFTGAGGLDIGFHEAGFSIVKMVEIDKRFIATLKGNLGEDEFFGTKEIVCTDICEYHPEKNEIIDFIIGGPPCQTFSAAGRRAAGVLGTNEERGVLFKQYVRLLKELSPRGFLFENVYGLTGAENGDAWKEIQAEFTEAGYRIHARIIDAADYGVPQHRERLFIVGARTAEYLFPRPTHGPDSPDSRPFYTASEALVGVSLSEEDKGRKVGGRYGELLKDIPPGLNYSFYTEKLGHPNPMFAWRSKFSDFLYKAAPDSPVRTIKAQGGLYTGPFHWDNRPFSISELKRLQTIPDKYAITGGRQVAIHQIGNSVPSQLARILALSILGQIFDIKLPISIPTIKPNEVLGFRRRKRHLTEQYRKIALAAIKTRKPDTKPRKPSRQIYRAVLSKEFDWAKVNKREQGLFVRFNPKKSEWAFCVSEESGFNYPKFEITLSHKLQKKWILDVEKVVLMGYSLNEATFTGLWKAFERELVDIGIKADLVQLFGYYQYEPIANIRMTFLDEKHIPKKWRIIQKVVTGLGVGKILKTDSLAKFWSIDSKHVFRYCRFLKDLGYEVRNKNTNPQIPENSFLIPYQFPTLNPMSVQLRKQLGGG